MKNADARPHKLRVGSTLDRVLAAAVFAFFAYLVWLALSGELDTEVGRFAEWLRRTFA